jgi:hypothetical protein
MARVALWHLATIILEPKRLSGLEGSLPRSTELGWPIQVSSSRQHLGILRRSGIYPFIRFILGRWFGTAPLETNLGNDLMALPIHDSVVSDSLLSAPCVCFVSLPAHHMVSSPLAANLSYASLQCPPCSSDRIPWLWWEMTA